MLLCNSWWYFKPGQFDVSVKDIKLWMDVPSNLFYILTLEYFKQQRKKTLEQIVWSSCQQAWRFKRNWMNLQWCSVLDTWNSSRVSFCSRLLNYHSYLCFFFVEGYAIRAYIPKTRVFPPHSNVLSVSIHLLAHLSVVFVYCSFRFVYLPFSFWSLIFLSLSHISIFNIFFTLHIHANSNQHHSTV